MAIKNVRFEYSFVPENDTLFDIAPQAKFSNALFEVTVDDKLVTVSLAREYDTLADARAVIEPFLRAWHVRGALAAGAPEFRLEYKSATFDEVNPTPGVLSAAVGEYCVAGAEATLQVSRSKYPEFPTDFAATPLVETLWHRIRGYQLGREPLLAMAYFCLTAVENEAGGRSNAVAEYRVDLAVLRKIGELTSTRGDASSARKVTSGHKALTPKEEAWLDMAVRKLIFQIGRCAIDPGVPPLSLADLPSL